MARHGRQSKDKGVTENRTANQYITRKRKNDESKDQHHSVNDLDGSFSDKKLDKDIEEIDREVISPKITKNVNADSSSVEYDMSNNENNVDNKERKTYIPEANMDIKTKKRSGANTCMVLSCLSPRQPGVIYHGFPKPNFPELQKQWLIACGRAINTVVLRHMRVCRYIKYSELKQNVKQQSIFLHLV